MKIRSILKNKAQRRATNIESSDTLNVSNLRKYIMKVNIPMAIVIVSNLSGKSKVVHKL